MSKLGVSREVIEKFSIDALKDLEGCPPAVAFLKKKYGNRVDDLLNCKAEVQELIVQDGKGDWAINFFLNLLKPHHRVLFYTKHLMSAASRIDDHQIIFDIDNAVSAFSKNLNEIVIQNYTNKLKKHLIPIKSELQYYSDPQVIPPTEDVIHTLEYEKLVIESALFFLDDPDRKFTRTITDALMKLAESKCCLNVVEYKYEKVLSDIALDLMEYTELWKK